MANFDRVNGPIDMRVLKGGKIYFGGPQKSNIVIIKVHDP
jgi:hypothetical protein